MRGTWHFTVLTIPIKILDLISQGITPIQPKYSRQNISYFKSFLFSNITIYSVFLFGPVFVTCPNHTRVKCPSYSPDNDSAYSFSQDVNAEKT